MAVIEDYPITHRHAAIGAVRERDDFLRLLLFYYGFMPVADIVSGILTTFREITWFAVAYKAGAVLLMLIFFAAGRIGKVYAAIAVAVTALLIVGVGARQSLGMGSGAEDLIYIARGPILLNSIIIVIISLKYSSMERLARVYFVSTWFATFLSVGISDALGISLTSYGSADYGSKGFYQAANEVTFTFILSWWYLQVRWANSWQKSAALFVATVYLIYLLGTKSGFVTIPILSFWYVGRWLGLGRFKNFLLFAAVSTIAIVFADRIFLTVLPYLRAADASVFFINTYGVNSTLTGGRFADLETIIDLLKSFSMVELMFGVGFANFWFSIAGKSVESDLIDTLGGGGIIFAGWFYGLLLWGYINSKVILSNYKKVDTAWAFVFIAVGLYSIFVGHVAFAASPLVTVGMFLALAYKEQSRESRDRTILV